MVSRAVAAVMLLVASLAAGTATPTPSDPAIPPVRWQVVGFTTPTQAPVTIADPASYTLQFLPQGLLLAQFDCNQGRGGYTAAAGVLTLTPMAVTTAMCAPDSYGLEVQRILGQATSYAFDPDGMLLLDGAGGSLRLQATLPGVVWAWQHFQSGDGTVVRPDDPSQYTVLFFPDGTVAIQADEQHVTGTYTVDGSAIDLTITGTATVVATPGPCPQGPSSACPDRFLRQLDQVVSHVFRNGQLYLALPADAGILAFAPTPVPAPRGTPAAG
jgi:heat shock protein HslJ